jgi:hypothetical protein
MTFQKVRPEVRITDPPLRVARRDRLRELLRGEDGERIRPSPMAVVVEQARFRHELEGVVGGSEAELLDQTC